MDELDFTAAKRPAKTEPYNPAIAKMCFEALGKEEAISQGGTFFNEAQVNDKMYLLVEGEVALVRGKKVLYIIKGGEIFGEMAAISRLPRSATATARTNCRALTLDPKQFQSSIQKTPEFALMLMNIIINRLRLTAAIVRKDLSDGGKTPETRVFDAKLLAELVEHLPHPPAHTHVNKVIMKEGDGGVFMYVVVDGVVSISVKDHVVGRIAAGGIFGEMALIDQSPRTATATAETDCELLSINRNVFLNMVKTNPGFAVALLKGLADRLRLMTSHHK